MVEVTPTPEVSTEGKSGSRHGEVREGCKRYGFTLPESWHKPLKRLAIENDMGISELVEEALRRAFPQLPRE